EHDTAKGGATLKTGRIQFSAVEVPVFGGQPPFLPTLVDADVKIPAVEQILRSSIGSDGMPGKVTIKLRQDYLASGLLDGTVQVFADFFDKFPPIALPADKVGGLAAPNFSPNGLSRTLGAVPNADDFARSTFQGNRIDLDGKLLGGVSLKDVIADLSG